MSESGLGLKWWGSRSPKGTPLTTPRSTKELSPDLVLLGLKDNMSAIGESLGIGRGALILAFSRSAMNIFISSISISPNFANASKICGTIVAGIDQTRPGK